MGRNKYETILSVSGDLINKLGFKGATFAKIADGVGIDKSTIFHYFRNKEEILVGILGKNADIANRDLKKLIADTELEPEEKLAKAIDYHLSMLVEHRSHVNIFINELRSLGNKKQAVYMKKRKEYGTHFENLVVELQRKGYFKGLDPKIVSFGILGMLNWVIKWYSGSGNGQLTIKEISTIFYRILTKK